MSGYFLTYQEAADELGISVRTVRRRVRDGYIRTVRPGNGRPVISRHDLEAHKRSPEHVKSRRAGHRRP